MIPTHERPFVRRETHYDSLLRAQSLQTALIVADSELIQRSASAHLLKDGIHDSGREQDFTVRYGDRSIFPDRAVERFDQVLHAGVHVEIAAEK